MNAQGRRVAKAAGLMMVTAFLSRLLGYVRDWFIYTHFGETYATDAFNAAFSIPDFIYMLLVGGALSSAFIPVFSSMIATERREEAYRTAGVVVSYMLVAMAVLISIAFIFTEPLVHLLAPKLPAPFLKLAAHLTRIMFIQMFFMALNGIAMGILNSHHHFTTPAWGGILYNLGIITVGAALVSKLGIAAFSWGVVVGAFCNFVIQIPALKSTGLKLYPSLDWRNEGFRQILVLMLPVAMGLAVTQFNLFVSQNLASGLAEGTITALRIAQRIMQLPIGIFAISIAIAVFPTLTSQAARGETDDFKRTLNLGLRQVFFITIPSALGLMAIGEPAIKLMFEWRRFTAEHTIATAQALFFYSLGLVPYSALQVLNRAFYAIKDTVTPVSAAVVTIFANIVLSIWLVKPLAHVGLALAYSMAGYINMIILMLMLRKRLGSLGGRQVVTSTALASAAAVLMYLAVRGAILVTVGTTWATKTVQLEAVGVGLVVGTLVYVGLTLALRMEEARMVTGLVLRKFAWKQLGK
ncbi:MAG: murein biosynthesis integral membrane protein MurJ [Syntrophothermus sp.]|uniref:murein biosynthesis integral membrane protein MurJ n=1 Tax=Syntrophothermus sp. TaxID=2736299 RepID=UPI00257B0008|nr:murein biosynthesis integral membrane protein MurJ [Syntrophothermus sp.]NSW81894.1 murein biosynthesis integral membrane protein MurJ [Syntrophothermus sp.]